MTDRPSVELVGRDFTGFRRAVAALVSQWRGDVNERWVELPELERIAEVGSADVLLIPADWLAPLAAAGSIRPLDGLLGGDPPEGWPQGWSASFREGIRWNSQVWGLPFHDGPQLLIYRKDIYEDVDERRAYFRHTARELAPPRTWDEFDLQARWFTRPDEDRWGTILAGAPDGHNNVYDFVVQLRRFGGDVLSPAGQPGFGGKPGHRALRWLRSLRTSAVHPEAHSWDSVESGDRFAQGHGALMANWAGFAQAAAASSPIAGRVGCALLPDGPGPRTTSVNAFWVLALTGHGDTAAAWSFVREAVSERGDRETTLAGASGARLSTWRDRQVGGEISALFEAAHEQSRPLPQIARIDLIVSALNTLVEDVVWGKADPTHRLGVAVAEARAALAADANR